MLASDFETFARQIRQLEKLFGKSLDDELMQVYWNALKDQPLGKFQQYVERHEKFGKFFPKPSELRPKEIKPLVERNPAMDAAFREGEARAIRNLEELRKHDPQRWLREVKTRYADRLLARCELDSPMYATAMQEARELSKDSQE